MQSAGFATVNCSSTSQYPKGFVVLLAVRTTGSVLMFLSSTSAIPSPWEKGQESASFLQVGICRLCLYSRLSPSLCLEASMGKHLSSATPAQCHLLRDQCQLGPALRTVLATRACLRWVAKPLASWHIKPLILSTIDSRDTVYHQGANQLKAS